MLLTYCIATAQWLVTGFGTISPAGCTDGGERTQLSDPLISSPPLWSWTHVSFNGPSMDFVLELTKVSNSS